MNRKFTIVYAEDELDIQKNFSYFLKSRYPSASIHEARNGKEALVLFNKYKPQILITDINMPEMDGLELIEKVRSSSKHTKIILLTAHNEQEKLLQAIALNVVNYLIKPINRSKLCEAIDVALETLPIERDTSKEFIYFDTDTKWNLLTLELLHHDKKIDLSKYETILLDLLCQRKNLQVDSIDIFTYVWIDTDKVFNSNSVRSLVKNLRKKLPEGTIHNIYGGLYVLKTY